MPRDGYTHEFEGLRFQDTEVSFIWVDFPHKFVNTGDRQLRQIDIHVSPQFIAGWLEE